MSTLIVDKTKILEIVDHPNADRLSIVTVKGWRVISAKKDNGAGIFTHAYVVGDEVIYVPIDAILPLELSERLQVTKYLSKGRVRTAKLRGVYSQGLVIPLSFLPKKDSDKDLKEVFGITKYEPPVNRSVDALPTPPGFLLYTNIENIKNFPDILEPNEEVILTEKIHGQNFRAANLENEFYVGSRRLTLKNNGNALWQVAERYKLEERLSQGQILFGELYGAGIQSLAYGLKNQVDLIVFDILENGVYLDYEELVAFCTLHKLPLAPKLYEGKWDKALLSHALGKSTLGNAKHIREGIVIKPKIERWNSAVGRVAFKHISEKYLLKDYDS